MGTTPTTPSPLIPILGESWSEDWIIILEELWTEDLQERQYVLFQKRKLNAFEYYWMMFTILPCIPNSYLLLFGGWKEWRNTTLSNMYVFWAQSLVNEENWIRLDQVALTKTL